MTVPESLSCISCLHDYPVAHYPTGCQNCAAIGRNSNLQCKYPSTKNDDAQLPVGELPDDIGQTPLIRFGPSQGGRGLNLPPTLYVKDESHNPTGSHKDRFSFGAVKWAADNDFHTLVAASSGNAALSLAAQCARDPRIDCRIVLSQTVPDHIADWVRSYGAHVDVVDTDAQRRNAVRALCIDPAGGHFNATNIAMPVVGSSPFGIEYYKTIAHEIVDSLGYAPDVVTIPTSRGDLAHGLALGFQERSPRQVPRLYLIEPFPRLQKALRSGQWWHTFAGDTGLLGSIGGNTTTVQSVVAARSTNGGSCVVTSAQAASWQRQLKSRGYSWEISSAVSIAALHALSKAGKITDTDSCIAIATSNMFKNI